MTGLSIRSKSTAGHGLSALQVPSFEEDVRGRPRRCRCSRGHTNIKVQKAAKLLFHTV
jgi:hypothetical protein